jgi:hypothetical protein
MQSFHIRIHNLPRSQLKTVSTTSCEGRNVFVKERELPHHNHLLIDANVEEIASVSRDHEDEHYRENVLSVPSCFNDNDSERDGHTRDAAHH